MEDKEEIDHGYKKILKVKLRRNIPGRHVKKEAEQIDGKSFLFTFAWRMNEDDPYPGEIAFMPFDIKSWPYGAPAWIASGDLVDEQLSTDNTKKEA